MSLAIADRYAQALADVVVAPGSGVRPEDALRQLREFEQCVKDSAQLRNVLLSPAVPAARKRAVVSQLAAPLGIGGRLRNFLLVVIDRRRVVLLGRILDAFETALDERTGRVGARVTAAAELAPGQRERIQAALARTTGKQVRCQYDVSPGLLGGFVVRVGSTVYDGSLRGQLERLRARMVD